MEFLWRDPDPGTRLVAMKRAEVIKCGRASAIHDSVSAKKAVPDKSRMKYFKWDCKTRMLLLNECLDKQVWTHPYGRKGKIFQDVCIVLKAIPNYEEIFSSLTWHKCHDEFDYNLASYKRDSESVPFKSGSSEDHRRWHDVMEENASLEAQKIEDTGVLVEQDAKSLQQDLKAAGELVRQGEYTKFVTNKRATKKQKLGIAIKFLKILDRFVDDVDA